MRFHQASTMSPEGRNQSDLWLNKCLPSIVALYLISITSPASGHNNLGDLDLYKITWMGQLPSETNLDIDHNNVINIATKQKDRYMCVVPDVRSNLNFDTSATNSSSSNQTKNPIQILEPLLTNGNYCSYKFELFWIYELCHGRYLRQYHEESAKFKTKITQEYYLGKAEPDQLKSMEEDYLKQVAQYERTGESRPTVLVNGHYKPYVMFNMTGGTKCDLTKKNRVSKIIYVCNEEPTHDLYSIKEISTCEYEAIVLSPLLCQHKDFKVDSSSQQEVKCYSLDGGPRKPAKVIEPKEVDGNQEMDKGGNKNKRGVAFLQGRTLIIDADLLFADN